MKEQASHILYGLLLRARDFFSIQVEQPAFQSGGHGGSPVRDLELCKQMEQVRFDGCLREIHRPRNLFIACSARDQCQDFKLAGTECSSARFPHLVKQTSGNSRRENRSPLRYCAHSGEEFFSLRIFKQVTCRASLDATQNIRIALIAVRTNTAVFVCWA